MAFRIDSEYNGNLTRIDHLFIYLRTRYYTNILISDSVKLFRAEIAWPLQLFKQVLGIYSKDLEAPL